MPDNQNQTFENTGTPAFIGLQSYSEEQSKFFFGRGEEISQVTTLVKSNILTIVFGKSGTGKTSLLDAGVFPKLRKDYSLPFKIRLEIKNDSLPLLTQIKNVLKREIDKYGFKVAAYPSAETLWEYFHKEPLWKTVTPILVFDQFEEIFNLAKKNAHFATEELKKFWEELSDLIENNIPDSLKDQFLNHKEEIKYNYKQQPVKVIFAFREEFLPEFESIPSKIPSLKYSRFRLMPMNQSQAHDVITKTWGDKINDVQAKKIISYLTSDEKVISISDIEPSLLSQVCFYLDKERIAQRSHKITSEFLDEHPKETILRSIYGEVMNESYDAVGRPPVEKGKAPVENPVQVFVEDNLITSEGYRIKYSLTENDEKNIGPGIIVLTKKYLVRNDGKSIELTHDVLTPIIKEDREIRRKGIATAAAKKKAYKRAFIIVIFSLLAAGFIWGFTLNEKVRLDSEINTASDSLKVVKGSLNSIHKSITDSLEVLKEIQKRISERNNFLNRGFPSTEANPEINQDESAKIASLTEHIDALSNQKLALEDNIDLLNTQVQELSSNLANAQSDNISLKRTNDDLRRQITDDKENLLLWRTNFEKLQKEFYDYKISRPNTSPGTNPGAVGGPGENAGSNGATIADDLDSNSLKLSLYNTNKPGTFNVYLIPDSSYNRAIIRDAEYYELRTNEDHLKKVAKNIQRAKFSNGNYYFPNLPVGKYLIKICTYYGGFYPYIKTKEGAEVLVRNASPPIR